MQLVDEAIYHGGTMSRPSPGSNCPKLMSKVDLGDTYTGSNGLQGGIVGSLTGSGG